MDHRSARSAEPFRSTQLSIHVLATTIAGTGCALQTAKRLAAGVDARVVLLVPNQTLYSTGTQPQPDVHTLLLDRYHAIAADIGMHVTTLVCVCRRLDDVVRQMLDWSSLVIIGGRRRLWWPTPEQRLVDRLTAAGYPAIFAEVGAGTRESPVPALVS